MFHNLLQAISLRPPADFEGGFVEEVRVVTRVPHRNARTEKLIFVCWLLITMKCWLVTWLITHYHMGFSAFWVTGPTVFFALMCTAAYFSREG